MKKTLLLMIFACCVTLTWGQSISAVGAPFQNGAPVIFDYSGGTGSATDWVGVYNVSEVPDGDPASLTWKYIASASGQITLDGAFAPLANGDYVAHLFCCDSYDILASVNFSVAGATPASIGLTQYAKADSSITFAYSGGTGSATDWIGIYKPDGVPGTDLSLAFEYIPSPEGVISVPTNADLPAGTYVAKLFCCDGYSALASTEFVIYPYLAPYLAAVGPIQSDQPVTFTHAGGTGSFTDWVGIYPKDTLPDGTPPAVSYVYVTGVNGTVTFPPSTFEPGVKYDAHFFCCDGYDILASFVDFEMTFVGTQNPNNQQIAAFTSSPSPAHEVVNLKFETPVNGQFTFYNMMGQAIRRLPVNGESTLEVRNLPVGTYIGQFQGEKGTQSSKIIVE
jgi:Secretion system C-terminal sorting domain